MSTEPNNFLAGLSDDEFDKVSAMDADELRRTAHIANGGEATYTHQKKRVYDAKAPSEVDCTECRGTGKFRAYTGRIVGNCFKCQGTGKFTVGQAAHAKGVATREAKRQAWAEDHADVIEYLNQRSATWGFAMSMVEAIRDYGSLTEGQMNAVYKCMASDAAKLEQRKAERAAESEKKSGEIDVTAIQALFARAVSNDIKRPIFRTEHLTLKASRKNAAVLFVEDAHNGTYLGKIVDGKFTARWEATEQTLEQLRAIATDPQAEAVKYGRLTSCCGVCGRGLVDPVSIRTGIGPICAERFGFVFARENARDDIRNENIEQAAKSDSLPADQRAADVSGGAVRKTRQATVVSPSGAVRAGTKKARVAEMIMSIGGTTVTAIMTDLGVTEPAAKALIGDVKRMGIDVTRDGDTYKLTGAIA